MNRRELTAALQAKDFSPYYRMADEIRFREKETMWISRGILEFSNICRRQCVYCGLNRANQSLHRYRMAPDEIIAAANDAASAGYRTPGNAVRGGPVVYPGNFRELVKEIKETSRAITLSCGEMPEKGLRLSAGMRGGPVFIKA